jgi:hypothetical protein
MLVANYPLVKYLKPDILIHKCVLPTFAARLQISPTERNQLVNNGDLLTTYVGNA